VERHPNSELALRGFISIRFKPSYLTINVKSSGSSSGGIDLKRRSRDKTLSSIVGRQNTMSVRMITCTGWNGYVIAVLFLRQRRSTVCAEPRGQNYAHSADALGRSERG